MLDWVLNTLLNLEKLCRYSFLEYFVKISVIYEPGTHLETYQRSITEFFRENSWHLQPLTIHQIYQTVHQMAPWKMLDRVVNTALPLRAY